MDIQLPGMNGIEALHHLRADPRTRAIPVIAVTASVMTQDRQKIMAAGFDGYQAKPIEVTVRCGGAHRGRSPRSGRSSVRLTAFPPPDADGSGD
jgi:DNA-binding response OmpR family regulator